MRKAEKTLDAVRMMRSIRDRMSEKMRGMTIEEQIESVEKVSGLRRETQHVSNRELGVPATVPEQA